MASRSRSRRRKSRGCLKWVGIVFLAMIVIGVIGNLLGIKPEETATQSVPNEVLTEAPATAPAETAQSAEDIPAESISGNKDWDIITREGHPTYYGSVALSHQIWDDVEKGKVLFADSYDNYKDSTILVMDAWRDSDMIRDVEVYLKNFEQPMEVSLEEILPTVATYMPFDIMDQYYLFSRSYKIAPDDGEGSCSYVVTYSLNKDAHPENEKETMTGSIDVIIQTTMENVVESFSIDFGTPRWMSSLALNSMHSEEWACDLYDYR